MTHRLFLNGILLSLLLSACTSSSQNTELLSNETEVLVNETETSENELQPNSFCTDTLTTPPKIPAGDVLELVQNETGDPEAYEFTQKHDGQIIPVDDNKSYVVWWEPEGFDPSTDTVVVSLHGHGSWAVKDFEIWHPELIEQKVAFLGLQWWFGRSLENEGYYEPDQIYALIAEQLEEKGIEPGNVIFQGFSMGSARSYGVTLYDHLCGEQYFGVTISNSGQWEDDYPLYEPVLAGDYGEAPFEGTKWILFCGEQDYNDYATEGHFKDVCEGMTHTEEVLTALGGTVELFIKDPDGDHGSFMINDENVEEGMKKAKELLQED